MQVKDIMVKNVITIEDRKTIEYALELMNENKIRRLPVISCNKLVGMIVQHDIEKAIRRPEIVPQTPVEWVMTKHLITIGPEEDIRKAVQLLITHKISGLPVIDEEKLVGIISETDILKLFINILESGDNSSKAIYKPKY